MRVKHTLLMLGMMVVPFVGIAQQQNSDTQKRIIDAVMGVYEEELAKDPNNYAVLYSRANQYYLNGELLKALDDVNAALKVTTRNDKQQLVDEYVLRAKIYHQRGNVAAELEDLREANRMDPESNSIITMLANAYYDNEDYETAKSCYQQLYRANNLNYEAIHGLAKVEVKQQNFGKAAEYVDRAVSLYPADAQVYINRADVLVMMNQYGPAAQDLISALSVSGDGREALKRLTSLADTQYDAVVNALGNSIEKAPNVGMFYYIRSSIEIDHFHYADALRNLRTIITNHLYDYHGIYYDAALCLFHLGKAGDALEYINKAISANDSAAAYYILKSQILDELGRPEEALSAVKTALANDANDVDALRQKALLNVDGGSYKQALVPLNEAIMNNPQVAKNLQLRAWLQKNKLKKADAAASDYTTMMTLGADMDSRRGFALHGLKRDVEAATWCEDIINDGILPGGECYYVASVLMAQIGNAEKALDYLESALANGYGSYYNVAVAEEGDMSLAPIRNLPRFKSIMAQYKSVFE